MEKLEIIRVANAEALAGDLFRKRFNSPFPVPRDNCGLPIPTPPENWRQYVALYRRADGRKETVAFCNWIKHGDVYLEGGLCVDESLYRRIPREEFEACRDRGGIGQMVMDHAGRELTDCVAWFAYCGDVRANAIGARFGYLPAGPEHLIVKWLKPVAESRKAQLVESMARIGPF